MKKSLLLGLALAGVLAASAFAQNGPADVVYECPNGNVTYSHAKHQTKVPACTECHPDPFGMAKSELGMEKGHAGCAKCHKDGGTAPMTVTAADACAKCHIPG
jgi:c(7)-type cytochrome triheme protein